ncbi:hypothetical protein HGM15179_013184 [Zosterops borbonicus]|uniref:Uncharacterized protein n=1 Tax=Zosterops borbonicus TaxID=364589 RepID=A0A8K1LHL1_9PASS|nr:hypothetical protein HGM15179_013184 [Zosterops borbonicus]
MKPAATAKVTLLLNCAPSSSGVKGIFSRTRTKGPNEQKLLEEDGCSANDFVASHITEATIIISFLTECFNKVPLKAMVPIPPVWEAPEQDAGLQKPLKIATKKKTKREREGKKRREEKRREEKRREEKRREEKRREEKRREEKRREEKEKKDKRKRKG